MEGPDHRASLEPGELRAMVAAIRNIEMALGSSRKVPSPSETKNIVVARKSIHLAQDLPRGHRLTAADLQMLRPGDGISPMEMEAVIGRELRLNLPAGSKLKISDLQ